MICCIRGTDEVLSEDGKLEEVSKERKKESRRSRAGRDGRAVLVVLLFGLVIC
jgi:hypothetical protein